MTSGSITITLGGATGTFVSAGVTARLAVLQACGSATLSVVDSSLSNFGLRLPGATRAYSISANGSAFRVAIVPGLGSYVFAGGMVPLVTRLLLALGAYSVTRIAAPLGVLMRTDTGDLDVTGRDAPFARDFEAWFPHSFDADDWIKSTTENEAWTPDTAPSASWSIASKQTEGWTSAIKQNEIWDAE